MTRYVAMGMGFYLLAAGCYLVSVAATTQGMWIAAGIALAGFLGLVATFIDEA